MVKQFRKGYFIGTYISEKCKDRCGIDINTQTAFNFPDRIIHSTHQHALKLPRFDVPHFDGFIGGGRDELLHARAEDALEQVRVVGFELMRQLMTLAGLSLIHI